MGKGNIFLIGGPNDELVRAVGARAVAAAKRPRPRVAACYAPVVGHTAGLAFMRRSVADMFPDADVARVVLPGEAPTATADAARRALEEADVVFVSGGDPVAGARLLAGCGADAWLRAAAARGAAIVGSSAGSIILGAWWAEWPEGDGADVLADDDETEGARLVACARVVPGLVLDAHDEADDWAELRVVARLAGREAHEPGEGLRFIGIPTGGAIVVDDAGNIGSIGREPHFLA